MHDSDGEAADAVVEQVVPPPVGGQPLEDGDEAEQALEQGAWRAALAPLLEETADDGVVLGRGRLVLQVHAVELVLQSFF